MSNDKKSSNKGCWIPILIFVGAAIFWVSPLNPFYETKMIGEEDYMTNSSWLITVVFFGGLIWFLVERFKDKE